jgi:argininosuccinate lyase
MKMWGGRFSGNSDERMAEFTRSIDFDQALALDDIAGSIAHVHGLERAGLLSADDAGTLVRGLGELRDDVEAGRIEWESALEDVHMNLEAALGRKVGATKSRPTSVSGCAGRSTGSTRRSWRWSGRSSVWRNATGTPSSRG